MKTRDFTYRHWFILALFICLLLGYSANLLLNFLMPSRAPVSCLLQKSTWEYGVCRYQTSDAGQVCHRSLDCQAMCITEESFPLGMENVQGVCYEWTTAIGCLTFVEYGIVFEHRCY
jgi:hypothetical protein